MVVSTLDIHSKTTIQTIQAGLGGLFEAWDDNFVPNSMLLPYFGTKLASVQPLFSKAAFLCTD